MPSIAAGVAALLGGWLLDAVCQPLFGSTVTIIVSLIGSTLLFYYVRGWLRYLRNG